MNHLVVAFRDSALGLKVLIEALDPRQLLHAALSLVIVGRVESLHRLLVGAFHRRPHRQSLGTPLLLNVGLTRLIEVFVVWGHSIILIFSLVDRALHNVGASSKGVSLLVLDLMVPLDGSEHPIVLLVDGI